MAGKDDDDNSLRIVELPTPDKLRASLEEIRRNLPVAIEAAELMARVRRANYLALLREGFTEAQALDLCWR